MINPTNRSALQTEHDRTRGDLCYAPPASGEKERTHRSKELNESILAGKLGIEVIFGQFHCTTSLGGGQGSRKGRGTNKVLGHLRV